MLFEHLIYSTAIAIIAGMVWFKRTGRDPSWIIIASAFAPDLDIVAGEVFRKLGMRFGDSFLFAGVGFGAHIFGQGRLSCHGYRYLWLGEGAEVGDRDEQVYF